jgi:ArsR family transcriptional regulator, lead/cadmium/zinc/bismuth-responsive transcriptional repressor
MAAIGAAARSRGRGRQVDAAARERCPVRVLHPEAIERARASARADEDYAELAEIFRALGDASRARILHGLLEQEMCVCDLSALVGISESAISQHLRVLRGLRLVRNRKVGRVVYYSLEDACIRALLTVAITHLDDPTAHRRGHAHAEEDAASGDLAPDGGGTVVPLHGAGRSNA